MIKKPSKAILFCVLIIVVFISKYNILDEPYHWDALGYVIDHSLSMYENNFRLIHDYNTGHPPFQYLTLALAWKIFGYSLLVSHLYIILIAIIGLFYTYKLGEYLFNFEVGVGAAILLLFNQLFFAQMGTLHHTLPLLTLGVISVFYYVKEKPYLFILFATLLLLIKETAAVMLLAIFIHFFVERLVNNKKIRLKDIKDCWFLIIPLIPLLVWFVYLKINLGWAFRTDLLLNKSRFFLTLVSDLFIHFFFDFTSDNANKYNFIIFIFVIIGFFRIKKPKTRGVYLLFILIIILHTMLFSYTIDLPRYFTVLMPFFYIMGANSIYLLFSELKYKTIFYSAVIMICVVLFISNYKGDRQAPGWQLESNLEYLDMLETHKAAANYIETNFPNSTVITTWPMTKELSDERYGYVSKKMKVTTNHRTSDKEVIVYYSPQSQNNIIKKFNKDDLTLTKKFEKNEKYTEIYLLTIKN